jgi:hypothetical protein
MCSGIRVLFGICVFCMLFFGILLFLFSYFFISYFIYFPVCMRVLLLVFSFFYRFLREAVVFRGLKIRVCLYLLASW